MKFELALSRQYAIGNTPIVLTRFNKSLCKQVPHICIGGSTSKTDCKTIMKFNELNPKNYMITESTIDGRPVYLVTSKDETTRNS
jgi:hypothetical protein